MSAFSTTSGLRSITVKRVATVSAFLTVGSSIDDEPPVDYVRSRVAHTLPFMYASHEHGQHLCHRVLPVACSGFLTVADVKCDVGATRDGKSSAGPVVRPCGSSSGEGLFRAAH
jgi:hypothetical protein